MPGPPPSDATSSQTIHLPTVLSRSAAPGASLLDRIQAQLSANLEEAKRFQPRLHQALSQGVFNGSRYKLVPLEGNYLSILDTAFPGGQRVLSAGADIPQTVAEQYNTLAPTRTASQPLAMAGIGDGYLLNALARYPVKVLLDMAQTIHVFEPDIDLVRTCFMLHDYTGELGPLRQQRVRWYVGPEWEAQYADATLNDLMLPRPACIINTGLEREAIAAGMTRVKNRAVEQDEANYAAMCERYDQKSLDGFIQALGHQAGRPPRVLFVTSKFTTVLQYATRDTADAFERMGWECRIAIESEPHERFNRHVANLLITDYEPDLVFVIDYLRQNYDRLFPDNVPMITWIQDHLPHLTKPDVGSMIDERNFVLSFTPPLFIDAYGYPPRQVIDMPMMVAKSRPAQQRPADHRYRHDLMYASNVSADASQLLESFNPEALPEELRPLAIEIAHQLYDHYAQGNACPSYHHLRQQIGRLEGQDGRPTFDETQRQKLVELLWNPLNITLYRQQALEWVKQAADALGLDLGLYGNGWENHPRFAAHAQGSVAPGPEMDALLQASKITLNLEPYLCFTHQRLLDGLMAGGFFLIREHPNQTVVPRLHRFLQRHASPEHETSQQVRQQLDPSLVETFDQLIEASGGINWDASADPVRQLRSYHRAAVVTEDDEALPHLAEVSFANPQACRAAIERFINDQPLRDDIRLAQRDHIDGRLTFDASMQRVMNEVVERLREPTPHQE